MEETIKSYKGFNRDMTCRGFKYEASVSTGDFGASSAENKDSIAIAWGYHGRAKGVKGSHLVLADWAGNEDDFWAELELKGAIMVQVDGEMIKENTWYTMKDGDIVEAKDDRT